MRACVLDGTSKEVDDVVYERQLNYASRLSSGGLRLIVVACRSGSVISELGLPRERLLRLPCSSTIGGRPWHLPGSDCRDNGWCRRLFFERPLLGLLLSI